jgi:hypothetical protein
MEEATEEPETPVEPADETQTEEQE